MSQASAPVGPHPGDAIDRARIRAALTAVAAVVAGGLGVVLGASYLEVCRGCDRFDALPLMGILPAWGAMAAVAAGRAAWSRSLASGVAGAAVLGFLALHFAWPGMVALYAPAQWTVHAMGWSVGFLAYWLLAAAGMVGAVLGLEKLAERL